MTSEALDTTLVDELFNQLTVTNDFLCGYLTALNIGLDSVASSAWMEPLIDRDRVSATNPERVVAFLLTMRDAVAKDVRDRTLQFLPDTNHELACGEYARGFVQGAGLHPSWEKDETARAALATLGSEPARLPAAVAALRDHWSERRAAGRVSRNDPCPCGSGKKYKKCCLR